MSVLQPFERFASYSATSFDIGWPYDATVGREQFGVQPVVSPEEITGWAMSDTYIIEVGSQPAGIIVRAPGGYRFFAASHRFNRLEGQIFRNAREAERAARQLASGMTLAA
jgi:hypothetical protein